MKSTSILALLLSLLLAGCSSNDDSASSSVSNPMTNSFSTMTSKLNAMDFSPPSASSSSLKTQTAFGTKWATDLIFHDISCSDGCGGVPQITAKDWMGFQIDPDAARTNGSSISVFGRIESALGIFCVIGIGLGNSSNYPTDGSHAITFTAAIKSSASTQCNFDLSDVPDGSVINLTVSTPSTTTNFEKKILIDLSSINGGTPDIQTYLFKATSTDINVATSEDNSNGVSRTVLFYDVAADVMRAEYVSGPDLESLDDADTSDNDSLHAEFYRLFYDATTDEGHMFHIQGQDSVDVGLDFSSDSFALSGKPSTTGGKFSLSMDSANLGVLPPYNACVNKDTGDILTDDSFCTPSATALDGFDVTGVSILSDFSDPYSGTAYKTISGTTVLNFTNGTNAATAAISTN